MRSTEDLSMNIAFRRIIQEVIRIHIDPHSFIPYWDAVALPDETTIHEIVSKVNGNRIIPDPE
jgi:hypothetical protein